MCHVDTKLIYYVEHRWNIKNSDILCSNVDNKLRETTPAKMYKNV
jgi:hypothetical protein